MKNPFLMRFRPYWGTALAGITLGLLACSDDTGSEGGPCFDNGTCNSGLVCLSKKCVTDDSVTEGSGGQASAGGTNGSGGVQSTGGSESSGGDEGNPSGGSGAATGTGGIQSSGGSGGSSTGGSSTGGSDTGGSAGSGGVDDGEIFDGTGVTIEAPDYGIMGSFFILEDSVKDAALVTSAYLNFSDLDGESSDEPSTFDGSSFPCVSGTIAVVTDEQGYDCELFSDYCDWESLWGGGIGLSLNVEDELASPWDATAVGATGFGFALSADSVGGAPIRFMVVADGEQFCTTVPLGATDVEFSDLDHECWGTPSETLDPSKITQVSWQFVNDASRSHAIDEFCVDSFSVLQ